MAATATADEDYRIVSTAVDQAFYRAAYPELDAPGLDPIRHYLEHGWREGRDPAPWFSVRGYLQRNPDIAKRGEEPLLHYLRHGMHEGREITPSDRATAVRRMEGGTAPWTYDPRPPTSDPRAAQQAPASEHAPLFSEWEREVVAAEFDVQFYAEANPDVARSGADLLEHFLAHGWREGRDPSPDFSVRDYLHDHPDIARAGVNPFAHYVAAGRSEGRAPKSPLGFRYKIIAAQTPLETRVAEAAARSARVEPGPASALAAAAGRSRTGLKDLHITFSHDDYARNVGGVQLCLQYEAARIAELGRDHLHLFAAEPWPVLRIDRPALLGVTLNGERIGAFAPGEIARALAGAPSRGRRSFAIHNLLGHQVDEVVAILEAAGLQAGFIWLHDFTSLCTGYQLLRNDVEDCAAPPPDSAACGICLYSPARAAQVAEHERLFARLRLTVVSPSKTTLDFWRRRARFPTAGDIVHPHVRLVKRARAPQPEAGPLRIAFLGMPSAHKGWPIFAELAARHAADPRYRFFHLGARRDPRSRAEFHPVSVSFEDPRAMQRAIEELEIDVAVIWSIFRETFCLAAYEAVGAGAAVITGPDSANTAAFVANAAHGRVLDDEAALAEALAGGDLLDLARRVRRPWLYDLAYSGMTADLLEQSVAA
jgi:hypothetical protein